MTLPSKLPQSELGFELLGVSERRKLVVRLFLCYPERIHFCCFDECGILATCEDVTHLSFDDFRHVRQLMCPNGVTL